MTATSTTGGPSVLQTRMQQQAAEERGRAIRALLATPFLTAEADAGAFDLVRRHATSLRTWFDETCGWTLTVEPRRGYARLAKVRPDPDPTRPARRARSTRAPFDRRRYTMLCLVAAELARPGVMTTVGLLAERVRAASAIEDAIGTFDTASRSERAAFVDACKLLEQLGVLRTVDGSSDAFVDSADAKVLFSVDEARLAGLLAAPTPPSRLGSDGGPPDRSGLDRGGPDRGAPARGGPDLERLLAEPRYGAAADPEADVPAEQRNRWLRHSITRRVLDDPVVHLDELTPAQRDYLGTLSGRRVVREAAATAGLVLEERAEGLLAVDPDGIATDLRFPDDASHVKHAALLLLDELPISTPVGMGALTTCVERWLARFPAWARAYRHETGAAQLAAEAVAMLAAVDLVRTVEDPDGVVVEARPAAARYATELPTAQPEEEDR